MYKLTDKNKFKVSGRYLDKWKDFYAEDQEMMPWNMMESLGNSVVIKSYVDDNCSGKM